MGIPAIVALPIIGLIVWGVSKSSQGKKAKDSRKRMYGITFDAACSRATIWDQELAEKYRNEVLEAAVAFAVEDSEIIMLGWLEVVDAKGCLVKADFTPKSAAIYARFWDSTLDALDERGYLNDQQFQDQSQEIWDFMDDFGLDEDEVDQADIVVKG